MGTARVARLRFLVAFSLAAVVACVVSDVSPGRDLPAGGRSANHAGGAVNDPGHAEWTVADGGSGDVVFGPSSQEERRSDVPLTLPAGVHQGGKYWYLLRFHYRVEIDPKSGSGEIHLVGSINDGAAALQVFATTRTAKGLQVTATELGQVNGARVVTSRNLLYSEVFRNYAQYASIVAGGGSFTFKVKQFGKARIRSVRIYADTAVERTKVVPAAFTVTSAISDKDIRVGDTVKVTYRITNRGGVRTPAGSVDLLLLNGACLTY